MASAEQCTATSKTTGERCKQPAVTGRKVCRYHGGKTPVGIASPQYKTGRHSKYLPSRLIERYDQALADPQLLELREEVALLDARLSDLLIRVDHGESGSLWDELQETFSEFKTAQATGELADMRASLVTLEELITRGRSDYGAWTQIQSVIEQRRKLVESERKRLVEMQQMMTAEQATVLVGYLVDAVRRHVTDRSILSAISLDVARVLGGGSVPAISAGRAS